MSLISKLIGEPEIRALDAQSKAEIKGLINKLVKIGKTDDFLSLQPGGPFDGQLHHREAKDIGRRVYQIGGLPLMMAVRMTIQNKMGPVMAEHLDHCWKGVGDWQA